MIGTQIESYLIQEKIGEGGMGTVYRALETHLDRVVAIKVLNTDLARDPAVAERFRAEARAQAHLNHTNLATLYSFLVHQGNPVMVMEYVDGENFRQIIDRRGPLPSHEVVPLFRQALLGIGAAHRMGIVHRDIKPSNLMLNRAGLVKVMDFGIAKMAASTRGLTKTGMQVGTVFYMSPEQVKGERVDIRSDIYALGITLYELLTANVPFSADSEFQILSDHVNTPPPPPTKFYPYLAKGIENAILKALEKNPDHRFQTVDEFGAALERPERWEEKPAASIVVPPAATRLETAAPVSHPPAPPASVARSTEADRAQPPQATEFPPSAAIRPAAGGTVGRLSKKAVVAAAATALVLASGGAAYVLLRSNPDSGRTGHVAVSQANPSRASSDLSADNSHDAMTPLLTTTPDGPPPSGTTVKTAARTNLGQLPQPSGAPQPARPAPIRERRKAPSSQAPAPVTPEPPAPSHASTPPPIISQASQAEMEEAQHRLMRLRSRAAALKSNLADLRRNLATQGMSVRSEAVEAEANLDSYLGEAERVLQAGDVQAARTNMDRAEHEAKKIAALVGG